MNCIRYLYVYILLKNICRFMSEKQRKKRRFMSSLVMTEANKFNPVFLHDSNSTLRILMVWTKFIFSSLALFKIFYLNLLSASLSSVDGERSNVGGKKKQIYGLKKICLLLQENKILTLILTFCMETSWNRKMQIQCVWVCK